MTLFSSPEVESPQDDGVGLLLHDIKLQLHAQADQKIRLALQIAVRSLAEQPADEIRQQLGLTFSEYRDAVDWLRAAVRPVTSPGSAAGAP